MDVGANDLFSVAGHIDDKKPHPVPLTLSMREGVAGRYVEQKVGWFPE